MKRVRTQTNTWLKRYARPLEMARWEFLFEGGSKEQVIHYLSAFQNEDGGFGHGLEPDFWLSKSSPMATWTAGQILVEITAEPTERIVKKLVSYLINTPQIKPGMWPSILPENNLYPHAPWWHWEDGVQENWMFNPSVELAAFLIVWSLPGSSEAKRGWDSLKHAFHHVMQATEMERHELKNYRQCLNLLRPYANSFHSNVEYSFAKVEQKVQSLTKNIIDLDVFNWGQGYNPLPLDFIQCPDDPLYLEFKPFVELNLQLYVKQKSVEGIWDIPWSWGQYPEDFAVARRYWQGIVAIERYKILNAFSWI